MAALWVTAVLLSLLGASASAAGQDTARYFRKAPTTQDSVWVGSSLEFQCQAAWAVEAVTWYINHRLWSLLDPPRATWGTTPDPNWNSSLHTLHLPALRVYNESVVQCVLLRENREVIFSQEAVVYVKDFWQSPKSINATLGSTVEFDCQPAPPLSTVTWLINNEPVSFFNSSDVKNTSEPGNYTRHTLQMTARLDFNNSIVQCKRSPVPDGPDNIIVSDGAKLSIQGELAPIQDLHVADYGQNYVLISWSAVFSLDITDSHPDLWYSVTVHNTANGADASTEVVPCSDYQNTTETYYNFTIHNNSCPSRLYVFSVTPVNALGKSSEAKDVWLYLCSQETLGKVEEDNHQNVTTAGDKGVTQTTSSCSSITLEGMGFGAVLGVVVTLIIAILVVLVTLCYCSVHRRRFRPPKGIPREKLQRNPSYEVAKPRQTCACTRNPAYDTATARQVCATPHYATVPSVSHRRPAAANPAATFSADTASQEGAYEEIK